MPESTTGLDLAPSREVASIQGCLLGGAIGDALGTPAATKSWLQMQQKFGISGIQDFIPAHGRTAGTISGKTQQALFTADGILRAYMRGVSRGLCNPSSMIYRSLVRWLRTQRESHSLRLSRDGWLLTERRLWSRRSPDSTTITALRTSRGWPADNDSKEPDGMIRAAPCAFYACSFSTAREAAHFTHGHPTGYLAAGLFADILSRIWHRNVSLLEAINESLAVHGQEAGIQEILDRIETVLQLHAQGVKPTPERIAHLGSGRSADEVLAIGLWCALSETSLEEGIITAVNHDGDSGSTGFVAGQLLGLIHGAQAIPAHWLDRLELRDVIAQVALDLIEVPERNGLDKGDDGDMERYPW